MKNLSLAVALLFMSIHFSLARNYYVSIDGKATNNGLSAAKPLQDLQAAANLTLPGDTVFVMQGTYNTPCTGCNILTIQRSGTPSAYIVYRNYPGHKPKLKFSGWQAISIQDGASYIRVIGFEIEGPNQSVTLTEALSQPGSCKNPNQTTPNPKYNGNGITVTGRTGKMPHHIILSQNTIHDCGAAGIGVMHADYLTIEDNLVYNNSWYTIYGTSGISLYQLKNYDNTLTGYRNHVRRNKCYQNRLLVPWAAGGCEITDGNGIIIDDLMNTQNGSKLGPYTGRTIVENNVVWYNGGTGIHTLLSEHVDIFNNTAYMNNQSANINSGQILSNSSNDVRIVNNILYAPAGKVVNSNYNSTNLVYQYNLHFNNSITLVGQVHITNLTTNPQFVSPGNSLNADFRLKDSSPAINKGSTKIYSKTDMLLKKRPAGAVPDLGAYENTSSQSGRLKAELPEADQSDELPIRIYPNPLPAQARLHIQSEQESIETVEGFGGNSQLLLSVPGEGQEMEVALPATMPRGLLVLKVTTESGRSKLQKILVE